MGLLRRQTSRGEGGERRPGVEGRGCTRPLRDEPAPRPRRGGRGSGRTGRFRADPEGVYLFGSLADVRAVPGSDADVLIVLSDDGEWFVPEAASTSRDPVGRTGITAGHARYPGAFSFR